MRASLTVAAACLALAACNPSAGDMPAAPTPPADAPAEAPATADFSKDINAVGTEPFWAVDIRASNLKLSGPDRKDLVAVHTGAAVHGGAAVWEGKAADATPLKITLATEACSDGMSDLTYPYKATVETSGEMLHGCAAAVDAWPKQPDSPAP